jgi:glutamine amidotransferase
MTYLTDDAASSASFENEYPLDKMISAMHQAVATVVNLQRITIGDAKRIPNSLNLCATDGIKLVAYRFRNHATSQPPSLYYSTKAGTTLNRKYPGDADGRQIPGTTDRGQDVDSHGKHLIVASEPSTYKMEDWELIGKNQYVATDGHGRFEVQDVPYEKEWDAASSP